MFSRADRFLYPAHSVESTVMSLSHLVTGSPAENGGPYGDR
jgi:hypothetical protein